MGYRDQQSGGDLAEPWMPKRAGSEIFGIVEKLGEATKKEGTRGAGTKYPVVTIRVAEGEEGAEKLTDEQAAIMGAAYVLSSEIEDKDPQPGDFVYCRYEGMRTSKAGNDFHHYVFNVLKGDAVPAGLRGELPELPAEASKSEEPW